GIFIGLVKGGLTGPIGGAIILPLLSQTMTVPQAAGITLPLLIVGDMFAMRFYWGTWDLKRLKLLLPSAIVGIVLGISLLVSLPDDVLRRMLGLITIGILIYKVTSDALRKVEYLPRNWHGYLAGFGSGFMSALANLGGPPITAYLLLQKLEPTTFVGTQALFFTIVNLLKLPGFLGAGIIDIPTLLRIAWVIPLIPIGVWIGRRAIGWVNRLWFERAMVVLLLWASLSLLFSS
ncbi:MAG: sulfite exporter TauE/SafE family protein, partial [Anaerolineae bacterium]|nr:sulfite exporter TauE/SafE family protein [Anaerolineae bacterium]